MSNKKDNKITIKVLKTRSFLHGIFIPSLKTVLTGLFPVLFLYFIFTSTLISNYNINTIIFTIAAFIVSVLFCWIFGEVFYCTGYLFVTQYLKSVYMDFSNEEIIRKWFSPSLKEISNLLSFYDSVYKANQAYRIACILIDWTIIKLFIDWSA